ncbi:uncharacterized protein [Littorina saxatilis]|uniref:uncharacterized protein isoform X2 n=1 Tax=Littorina saxatilis TaxID=31220 RepID=UPI0038B6168E
MALLVRLSIIALLSAGLLQSCCCQEDQELIPGDVTLGALFSVNNIQNDVCGDYDVDTLKAVTAVKWFLTQLNDMNYIPGVKIGLEAYRTCQNGELAVKSTVRMLEKFHVLNQEAQTINSTTPLFGLLGPGRTQEAMAVSRFLSSLPSSQRVTQISGSATGADLSDKNVYSNFFRVIPPDSTQVQVLLKLLQQLGWNYFSIVYDNDAYGREAAQQLRDLASQRDLCVPSFESLPLDYRSKDFVSAADVIIDRIRGGTSSIIKGVVFIGSATTAREFISRLATRVSFVRFIFSEAVGLHTSVVSHTSLGKGALVASPPFLPLPEFKTFWNSLWTNWTAFNAEMDRNTFLADYYTTATSCDLADSTCWANNKDRLPLIEDNTQWLFEYYQVKAAAVFAAILKKLHMQTCGQDSSGVCLELKNKIRNDRGSIRDTVQTVHVNLQSEFSSVSSVFSGQTNVGFDQQGEVTSGGHNGSLYNVYNYRECSSGSFCFQQVGMYTVNGQLQLDTNKSQGYDDSGTTLPKAQCTDNDCLECLPNDIPGEIVFVPGDVYIVAVAPVHDRVAQKPLGCGTIRQEAGADFVQSVLFAVHKVNEKQAPFNNVFGSGTLGVLILNSCFRELVIKEKLIELHKGTLLLPDGHNSSDILPQIAGYVGAFFSTVSIAMYEVLTNLDTRFVLLSPANTSPELSDRSKYPLYLRLTAGHNTQVNALLALIRELGHQFVQVLYDPDDNYSMALKERINDLSTSKPFNICVVNNIVSDSEGQSFYTVLDDLRKNLWAPLVIVTLQAAHSEKVLNDILSTMIPSDKFLFLGTDAWGRNVDLLTGQHSEKLLGSLSLTLELPLDQLFAEYLKRSDPLNTPNPWLKYFWEARKNCYFDGSFRRRDKTGLCPAELTDGYVQNLWVPHYINAVYAFALGLDSALEQYCGQSHQAYLCDTLTSEGLAESLKTIRLDLFNNGRDVNVFDSNGDGDIGFKMYEIALDSSSPVQGALTYSEVGRFDHDSLQLHDKQNLWAYRNLPKSKCPNSNACNACFNVTESGVMQNTGNDTSSNEGAVIAMAIIIVILIIGIVVLIVVFVLGIRRLRRQGNTKDDQKIGLDNLAGPNGSRPMPPVHSQSTPAGFLHQNSVTSGSASGVSASGSVFKDDSQANNYDYLLNVSSCPPSRHSYAMHPTPGVATEIGSTTSASASSLDSDGYVPRSSGEGQLPGYVARSAPARQISQLSAGVNSNPSAGVVRHLPDEVARQNSQLSTGGYANPSATGSVSHNSYELARSGPARQNSQLSAGGDSNPRAGAIATLPIRFENDPDATYATESPVPRPHHLSSEPDYLTPTADLEAPTRDSYMDLEGTVVV